jgi:hypothetical protein
MITRRASLALILASVLSGIVSSAHPEENGARLLPQTPRDISHQRASSMKIVLKVGERTVVATLDDNPTVRDFASLLPMTLALEDYAATEKISYLPRKLSKEGAPAGVDPSIGDIAYYAPWGNLAIFYKDFGYSSGLVKLGKIDSGLEALSVSGSVKVMIERTEE